MIKEFIKQHQFLLFDGAFGTYYASRYPQDEFSCEMANVLHPKRVLEIHREYIVAGAQAIKTNTFSANTETMDMDAQQVRSIITNGYKLACDATNGKDVFVFADIGPMSASKDVSSFEQYKEIVDIFLELGATNFLFETFYNRDGLLEISAYIKSCSANAYVLVSFAASADGYTRQGLDAKKLMQEVSASPYIDACGLNCVCGPMHLHRLLQTLERSDACISIMPNSGYPSIQHNRTYFRDNSTYFAQEIKKIIEDGAQIIGGCCGTTPSYIKEICDYLKYKNITKKDAIITESDKKEVATNQNPLLHKLRQGRRIIAVEFDPPNNCDIQQFMENAQFLKEQGVDAITIADCPIARARVDSSLLAAKVKREMSLEVIPHMTCRDRNINATKALLFGLQIEDIHNVLVVTGDPIPQADRGEVKGVFNFNSQILANYIHDLNDSVFPHPFLIYGALNINAINFKQELEKAKRKEASGVGVFMTQPVLSQRAIDNLKRAKRELHANILGGIIPIVSHRNALYMNNEIEGIDVDEYYSDQYIDKTREEASALAVRISCEIANKIADSIDGYYLITPFNRVDIIGQIIAHIQDM